VSNPSKRKGSKFEVDVVNYLQTHGFPHAERRALRGVNDAGDVAGVVGWVLEVKNHAKLDIGNWSREAAREAVAGSVRRWAVIHKKRQANVSEAYVTMPLRLFAELLGDVEHFTGDYEPTTTRLA
jgi:hypothetical protein